MQSTILGQLQPDQQFSWRGRNEWFSAPVPTPFFEQQPVRYRLMLNNQLTTATADKALQHFFNCSAELRQTTAQHAFQNWQHYNEMVGYLDAIDTFSRTKNRPAWMEKALDNCLWLQELTQPEKVWPYLTPTEIVVTKDRYQRTKDVYLQLLCDCAWQEEHGLQIVLRNGRDFWRLGEQDGNLF